MKDDLANKQAAFHALIPVICALGKQHDVHPYDMIDVLLMAAANIVALRHATGPDRTDTDTMHDLFDAEADRYVEIVGAVMEEAEPTMRAAFQAKVAARVLDELEAIRASRRP